MLGISASAIRIRYESLPYSEQRFKHDPIAPSRDNFNCAAFLQLLCCTSQHHCSRFIHPRPQSWTFGHCSRHHKVYVQLRSILITNDYTNLCFVPTFALYPVLCVTIRRDCSCLIELSLTLRRKIDIDKPPDRLVDFLRTQIMGMPSYAEVILSQNLIAKRSKSSINMKS